MLTHHKCFSMIDNVSGALGHHSILGNTLWKLHVCVQAEVSRMKSALSSSRRGPVVQTAIAVNDDEFFKGKLDAYLRDLPNYQEHGCALQEALGNLALMVNINKDTVELLNSVLCKYPKWRDSLRPSSMSQLQTDILEKVKLISNEVNLSDKELVQASQACVAEACILFPMNMEVQSSQDALATRLSVHEQSLHQQAVMAECEKLLALQVADVVGFTNVLKACMAAAKPLRSQSVVEPFTQAVLPTAVRTIEVLGLLLTIEPLPEAEQNIEYAMALVQWLQTLGGLLRDDNVKRLSECASMAVEVLRSLWQVAEKPKSSSKQHLLKFKQHLDEYRKMEPRTEQSSLVETMVAFHAEAKRCVSKHTEELRASALADMQQKQKVVVDATHGHFQKWQQLARSTSFTALAIDANDTISRMDADGALQHCAGLRQVKPQQENTQTP